jgi:hypothetical protein
MLQADPHREATGQGQGPGLEPWNRVKITKKDLREGYIDDSPLSKKTLDKCNL